MGKVKITRMYIENFKGLRCIDFDFCDNITEIRGKNATGKTTIVDAFTWCLFGKDSSGRTAFSLKTIDEKGVIPKIEHFVELYLDIQDDTSVKKVILKRLLKEDWVKPRGKAESVMQGNTTHYYINGMEVKATQYNAEVSAIIDEQMFRLVTSPSYFPTIEWKQQRELLVKMAGNVSYNDVAFDSDLKNILSQLDGKDIAAFKAMIASNKKPIKSELDECPTKISAIESVTPETKDFNAIETEIKTLEKEYNDNLTLISNREKAYDAIYAEIQAKQKNINDMRMKQMEIVSDAEQAERQRCNNANSEYNEKKMKFEAKQREMELFKSQSANELKSIDADINSNKERAEKLEAECAELREKWGEVNGTIYTGSEAIAICPLLNVACSDQRIVSNAKEQYAKALKSFSEKKAAKLAEITETGKSKIAEKSRVEQYVVELSEKRETRSVEIADEEKSRKTELDALWLDVSCYKIETPKAINPNEISEWMMLEKSIKSEEQSIQEPIKDNDTTLVERNVDLQKQINALNAELAKRDVISTNTSKIAEIEKREKELAQQLADLEGLEYHADRLENAYVSEVESRVNKMFAIVRFKMFEKQINGGEYPTCVAMVNNVPYSDLNNAMKINAGIDIINTLCKYWNISAPIFVDNAESVNEIIKTDSQLVKLVVTEDEILNITSK